ncbi:YwmB family TATA-box binding protein [Niallia sp. XMNu-256]|uniref:YwmB family TATA-box binding protein n=1 Tax=Niallia sp. XMNu-256 TaxID=3082444 RepID=UPI0030D303A2
MKKLIMVLFGLSAVGLIFLNITNAKTKSDLFIMASILEEENVDIDQWTLHGREPLESSQKEEKLSSLMSQYPDWNWIKSGEQENWEATGVFTNEWGITETISILSSEGHSYLMYEVNGNGWNQEIKDSLQNVTFPKINEVFHEKAMIFACIYSEIDGNMYESVSTHASKFLQAFQAEEIETLREDNFVSATAYSPLFSESIKGHTERINLQLGLRNQGLGGKTTLVVGTPIITIEY